MITPTTKYLLKCAFTCLHRGFLRSRVKLETVSHSRLLRSSNGRALKMTLEAGPFQDSASKLFNRFSGGPRNCTDYFHFSTDTKTLLLNEAKKNLSHLYMLYNFLV